MIRLPQTLVLFARRHDRPIHLAIDSTGLKIMGDGIFSCQPWHAHKHWMSNKRRAWRKLHLAVDSEGFISASELTGSGVDDASVGVALIERIDASIQWFTADGAYDTRAIYDALAAVGVSGPTIVIPPRKTASPSKPAEEILVQRDAAIERVAVFEVGRRQWQKETGAHQQARAENGMYRYRYIGLADGPHASEMHFGRGGLTRKRGRC
ncbi:MAG: hypothetical protein ACI9WU_003864 [Myxococcota bacterium]|jgi:hypothetical protein